MIDIENNSLDELQKGFSVNGDGMYTCAYCGKAFEPGEVFPCGEKLFAAERAVGFHLEAEHPDRFHELLLAVSPVLSLTERQKELLTLFQSGMSDGDIAKRLGLSASTVRHQKFMFRERAKTARLFLALWGMAENSKNNKQAEILPVHERATMVDERYIITEDENQKICKNVFYSLEPLRLKAFPPKEKKKIVILRKIIEQFEPKRSYTEPEVNDILRDVFEDYVTLRRYLIEYGYMERTADGAWYWRI